MAKITDDMFGNDHDYDPNYKNNYPLSYQREIEQRLHDLAAQRQADKERPSPGLQKTDTHDAAYQRQRVHTKPTQPQIDAGNYRKGHIDFQGLHISIENPRGGTRSGQTKDGLAWTSTLAADYGYIKRTTGADGDQLDVYVGPNHNSQKVWLIDQVDPETREFDEHKAMVGFLSQALALAAYEQSFSNKADRVGEISELTVSEFKSFLRSGDLTQPFGMAD